jgi:tripartite-type tricarboxylate transporter receptor subunit TctC
MNVPSRRQFLQTASRYAALCAMASPLAARARAPDTVKILCGYPPGSPPDIVARKVGDRIAGSYGRTVIIENKTGAAGRLAVDALKASAPDGGTILLTPASVMTMYPYIYPKLSYNPFADVAPVSLAADFSHALAVGPLVPPSVRTARDFIGWCRANPASASCGNPGAGSLPHLLAVLLEREGAVAIKHVPYRGTILALQDVVGGQIASAMGPEGNFLPLLKDGRVRVISLTDSSRSRFLPEVPTFVEQGFKSIELREWFGLFMPVATPRAVVADAAAAIATAVTQADVVDAFALIGMTALADSPSDLDRKVRFESEYWKPVIKSLGFTAES